MIQKIKRMWRRLKAAPPGRRFKQQFCRRDQSERTPMQKALFIGGGGLLMAAGIFLLFVPGPGLLVLLLGAALIAQQSLFAARALDWAEIRVRRTIVRNRVAWGRSPGAVKILLVVSTLIVVGAVGFGAFKFVIGTGGSKTVAWLEKLRVMPGPMDVRAERAGPP